MKYSCYQVICIGIQCLLYLPSKLKISKTSNALLQDDPDSSALLALKRNRSSRLEPANILIDEFPGGVNN
jgi:hypothetical protein